MRRNKLTLLLPALLLLAACTGNEPVKVSVEIPGTAALAPDAIPALLLAGFRPAKPAADFDVSAALVRYFRDEFKPRLQGPVDAVPVVWPGPEALTDKAFWKKAGAGRPAVFLAGLADFVQETRKALVDAEARDFDGPFQPRDPWAQRKFFSLQLDLAFIDARTGEILFRRSFQESLTSENIKQTADFAVFDMLSRIKIKLLRALFGSERPLDRYLLVQ
jgi:hypothetical protein